MKKLLLLLCLAALPAISQSTNITGIPSEAAIYKITFKAGKAPRGENVEYGAIKVRGEFLQGDYPADEKDGPTNLTIVFDTPADPGNVTVLKGNLQDVQPDSTSLRLKRYTDAGFVVVQGRDNTEILIPKVTQDRMNALEALQAQQAQEAEERIAPFREMAPRDESTVAGPGPLSLWGPHGLTVVLAALALYGVIKTLF